MHDHEDSKAGLEGRETWDSLIASASTLVQRDTSTRLPYLDTQFHSSRELCRSIAANLSSLQRVPTTQSPSNQLAGLLNYAAFILDLCGEDSCYVSCIIRLQGNTWKGHIHASRANRQTVALEAIDDVSRLSDFSFAYSAFENEDFEDAIASAQNMLDDTHRSFVAYDKSCLQATTFEHLKCALISYVDRSVVPVSSLSVLNYPPEQVRGSSFLQSKFYENAERYPDREAIVSLSDQGDVERLNYGQVMKKSITLARRLQHSIASRYSLDSAQHVIPVYMSTSQELYISYLAILQAGHAFCPLPVDAPSERLRRIVNDQSPPLIIGRGRAESWVEVRESTWIDVDSLDAGNSDVKFRELLSTDLAYVMYTSGTTGNPKGVQITHEAACSSISGHMQASPLKFDNGIPRWFQFAAPTFDPSIMEIFMTLSSAATLCCAPRSMAMNDLEGSLAKLQATSLMATPNVAELIQPGNVPTLCEIWTMGETLSQSVIKTFANHSDDASLTNGHNGTPKTTLNNAYGPTEAGINCTMAVDVPRNQRGSIIGSPLPSCSVFIVSPKPTEIRLLPLGFNGELVIGGPQISVGYLRSSAADASFVNHPKYGRLYRTGDRARTVWSADGQITLEYLGRVDDQQVKVNGQRVELAEIDANLKSLPWVSEAATVLKPSAVSGGETLIACIVRKGSASGTVSQLEETCRKSLKNVLPVYMQPSHYVFLSSLPRSRSDKLDRRALAAKAMDTITESKHDRESTERMESDPLLRMVHEVFVSITGSLQSSSSHFVMDSLTSMHVLHGLRRRSINELSLKDILHAKSIVDIVRLIMRRQDRSAFQEKEYLASTHKTSMALASFQDRWSAYCVKQLGLDDVTILPTTTSQTRLLLSFDRDKSSDNSKYINQTTIQLQENVDSQKLQRALQTVLERHEIFQSQFVPIDDDMSQFAQCTGPSRSTSKKIILETDVVEGHHRKAYARVTLRRPIDIVLITSENACVLMLTMLHAIFDYGSLRLLLEEVESKYFEEPTPTRTGAREAVINHFSAENKKTEDFWSQKLDGATSTLFPQLTGLRPELAAGSFHCSYTQSFVKIKDLEDKCRSLSCSPLSVVQAAWSAILFAYCGSSVTDVTFDSLFSNRLESDTENCMAPTFSVLPTTIHAFNSTDKSLSLAEILHRLTSDNAESQKFLHPRVNSAYRRKVSYDTILALQIFDAKERTSRLFSNEKSAPMAQDHVLMMELWPDDSGCMLIKATYRDTHLDDTSAQVMGQQLATLLHWIPQNPGRAFIDCLGAFDNSLLSISNPSPTLQDSNHAYIQSQFEQFEKNSPDEIALVFVQSINDESRNIKWSYHQLGCKANLFAKALLDTMGPLQGRIVPILMEKRPELYIAVLGIVKAGGAWCPIDTSSPIERRRELISRTHSSLLVIAQEEAIEECYPEGVRVMNLCKTELSSAIQLPSASTLTHPSKPAYLIWTSGTTGAPKGVPVSHTAAVTSMTALQDSIPGCKHSRVPKCTQFSQHTFDVFVQDLFYTWGLGGTVVSATKEILIGSFPEFIRVTGATHAHLTPAFGAGVNRASCPSLEVVTMIGEKLPQQVADDWGENTIAFNTYGPAEATVVSTLTRFGRSERTKSANIGRPLPTVSCYVVRNESFVMTQGAGELALGGYQLASGYYENPSKTADKFKWNEQAQQLIYMTGDIVRLLADGSIEFVGREDDLVKLGGIRVELSEISFALRNCHPQALQIETFHMQRPDRAIRLVVSFVVVPKSKSDTVVYEDLAKQVVTAVHQQGKRSLPDFMIPSVVIPIEAIPKTPSAKIDRKRLQSIFESFDLDISTPECDAAERKLSSKEFKILEIVSSLCGVPADKIKIGSYLPSLGIDSLNAGRLASRLQSANFDAQNSDVLKSHTISDLLTNTINGQAKGTPKRFDIAEFSSKWQTVVDGDCIVIPASMLQEGLLSESIANTGSYWSTHLYKTGSQNIARLQAAWMEVAERNESLRTSFMSIASVDPEQRPSQCNSAFLQVIQQRPYVDWEEIELVGNVNEAARFHFDHFAQQSERSVFLRPPWGIKIFKSQDTSFMMLMLHHSLHDALSLEYLIDDVTLILEKRQSELPQRHQLTDCMSLILSDKTDEEYWQEALVEFRDEHSLSWPDLTERPEHLTGAPKLITITHAITLDMVKLQKDVRSLNSSLSSLFKAALGILLTDYLEVSQIIFGEVYSLRSLHPNMENAIAPLVVTRPVLFNLEESARELLLGQEKMIKLHQSKSISGPLLRKVLGKDLSQPLYPAVFVFHPDFESGTKKAALEAVDNDIGLTVEHPLAVNILSKNGWQIELAAHDTFITIEHLNIMAKQMEALVQSIMTRPDDPIAGLLDFSSPSVLSIAESQISFPDSHPCTLDPVYWLKKHSSEHPQWPAAEIAFEIGASTQSWSYQTLLEQSGRIASTICKLGYRGKIIGLCAGRSLQSYACTVGIIRSGNTYLPIDDKLPPDRKQLLLEDSKCVALFTDRGCSEMIPKTLDCQIIDMDENQNCVETVALPKIDPSENAYLLYTSGSTGRPKGVLVSHKSLCGFVEGLSSRMFESSADTCSKAGRGKWLGLASRAFDVHLGEMFLAWKLGLAVVTAPREALLDDLRLALTELEVTHTIFVPSLLEQSGIERSQIPDVVFMAVGGEKLTRHIIDKWANQPGLTVVNAYGPTELAIGCTASHIKPSSTVRDIGRPYGNSQAHVLLPGTSHYAKRGQSGELCFTGCLVGNGYLDRPDAKGFVDNFRGQRMYRTGDMVRMMANDHLEYLGRSDDQTKIRGQRIELAEVSETIRAANASQIDVATMVLAHPSISTSQLIAFVAEQVERSERYGAKPLLVEKENRDSELLDFCRQRLPSYMVPDHIVPINILPLAQISGKVDAKVLKAFFGSLELNRLLGKSTQNADRVSRELTPAEKSIKVVIQRVLKVEDNQLTHDKNLIALGLDSLSIVGLVLELRKLGLQATVASILANPTIEAIASRKKGTSGEAAVLVDPKADEAIREGKDDIEDILPCLPLQESLVATTLNSEDPLYINDMIFRFQEPVSSRRLTEALHTLVRQTPILRTTFQIYCDKIYQIVHKPDALLGFKGVRDSAQMSKDILSKMHTAPPWRFEIVEQDANPVLHLSMHHGLYDGNSLDAMLGDLYALYAQKETPLRTSVKPLLQHIALQSADDGKRFWKDYLSAMPPVLPEDGASSHGLSEKSIELALSSSFDTVQSTAKSLRVTPASLLQGIFGTIMAKALETSDFVFGAILSGRSVPVEGVDTILAPCIATIPQRIQFAQASYLDEVLATVQQQYAQCIEFQHTPLRTIRKLVGVDKLFNCLYSFNNVTKQPAHKEFLTQDHNMMAMGYPFAVEFQADENTNTVTAQCSFTASFDGENDARNYLEQMNILLEAVCRGERIKVSELGLAQSQNSAVHSQTIWPESTWTEVELLLRNTVSKFAGLETSLIGKNSSFFSIGLDSISAIRLASDLRSVGLQLSSSDIMRYSSIGSLGNKLSDEKSRVDSNVRHDSAELSIEDLSIPLDADKIEAIYPCTPLQAGMITGTIISEGAIYVHTHAVLLDEKVNSDRLRSAWFSVVNRVDVLRTSFYYVEKVSRWFATVHSEFGPEWIETSVDSNEIYETMKLKEDCDFAKPPVNAGVQTVRAGRVFFITMHHALYDGKSIPMLFKRIAEIYKGNDSKPQPSFSKAALKIAQVEDASVSFWNKQLSGYRWSEQTTANEARAITAERKFEISSDRLRLATNAIEVTVQTLSLVSFAKALACSIGQRDVTFGHVVAGRMLDVEETDSIIGPMFNTIPFRIRLGTLDSSQSVLRDVQNLTADAQPHQHASLKRIQNEWRQHSQGSQLFDTIFLFQPDEGTESYDLWKPYGWDTGIAGSEYRLNFEVRQVKEGFDLVASGTYGSITTDELEQLLNHFVISLGDIIDDPGRSALAVPETMSSLPLCRLPDQVANDTHDDAKETLLVRRIISQISGLPLETISPDTSIFRLGLDSISAIKVASSCREKGLDLSVAQILKGSTPRGITTLALQSESKGISAKEQSPVLDYNELPIQPVNREMVDYIMPCLSGQNYHLANWLQSGRILLQPTWVLRCGRLDMDFLERAWKQLRYHHPILRTTFARISRSEVAQIVIKADMVDERIDIHSASTTIESLRSFVRHEQQQTSDLSRPPVRLRVIRGTDDVLLLTINHALYDAWSLPILISDLESLYKQSILQEPPQFDHCVSHVLSTLQSEDEASFWRTALQGHAPTIVGQTESVGDSLPSQEFFAIPAWIEQASMLQDVARRHNARLPNVILLALARVLARRCSIDNPVFGLYQVGRSMTFPGADRISGPCLNLVPLLVQSPLQRTADALSNLQSSLESRTTFEQSALPRILEWIGAEDILFNVYVNVLWHQKHTSITKDSMFEIIDLGVPTDFSKETPHEGTTAIDGLEWPLAKCGLYIDISLNGDQVNAGVRVEGGIMQEAELKTFLLEIGSETHAIIEELG